MGSFIWGAYNNVIQVNINAVGIFYKGIGHLTKKRKKMEGKTYVLRELCLLWLLTSMILPDGFEDTSLLNWLFKKFGVQLVYADSSQV